MAETIAQLERRVANCQTARKQLESSVAEKNETISRLRQELSDLDNRLRQEIERAEQRERANAKDAAHWKRLAEEREAVLRSLGKVVDD